MRKRKKDNLRILLVVLLLSISLGYAFLQTDLTINGTGKIAATSWNVYFDNVRVTTGSAPLQTGDQVPTINSTTLTDITYTITLKEPGEFYEFLVDVVNDGTLDGMIGTISSKLNGVEISPTNPLPTYASYTISYADGTAIANNHILEAGYTETYKVRLAFRTDISPSDLPTTGATLQFAFGLNYIQADNSSIPVPHPVVSTVYMANMNSDGTVNIGSAIPNSLTQYETAADAMAALTLANSGTNVPFCLKHTTADGIVTESYVEFVVTSEMATANPGMTAGTYALRGAGLTRLYDETYDYYYFEDIPYEANKTVLQTAFGVSNCTDNTTLYSCSVSGLDAYAISDGYVDAGVGSFYCLVDAGGASGCDGK